MDLKDLLDTPPWDWPRDAGKRFQKVLIDDRAGESDRLVAAELAGGLTVVNDELAASLTAIVRNPNEPDRLRAKAAISLGPVLEQAYTFEFEDPDDVPITERTFRHIQNSLEEVYCNETTPKGVRRRVLEASVRAPESWHQDAIEFYRRHKLQSGIRLGQVHLHQSAPPMRDSLDDAGLEPFLESRPDLILRFLITYAKHIFRDRNGGRIANLKICNRDEKPSECCAHAVERNHDLAGDVCRLQSEHGTLVEIAKIRIVLEFLRDRPDVV